MIVFLFAATKIWNVKNVTNKISSFLPRYAEQDGSNRDRHTEGDRGNGVGAV